MPDYFARKTAKAKGEIIYFTGLSCPHGHIAYRRTQTGRCIVCDKEKQAEWRKENRDKKLAIQRAYRARMKAEKILRRASVRSMVLNAVINYAG